MAKRIPCPLCEAQHQKLLELAKQGKIAEAAQAAVVGVGMMVGIIPKDQQKDEKK